MKYNKKRDVTENSLTYKLLIDNNILSEDILKGLELRRLVTKLNSDTVVFPNNAELCLGDRGLVIIEHDTIWSGEFPKNMVDDVIRFIRSIILSKQKPHRSLIFDKIVEISDPMINEFYKNLSESCKNRLLRFSIMSEYRIVTFTLIDKKRNVYYIYIDASSGAYLMVKMIINYKTYSKAEVEHHCKKFAMIDGFLKYINIDEI